MSISVGSKLLAALLIAAVIAELALAVVLCCGSFARKVTLIDFTVVIDAGHGGIDGGVVAADGTKESTLNLAYARQLGQLFERGGFCVVYTRRSDGGLYGLPTKGFKARDMQARKKIVDEAHPNLLISVHMNKFAQSSRSGPQVFYQQGSDSGLLLAQSLQRVFNDSTGNSHEAIGGDYYMCREVDCPAVIVECGFLSNAEECALLQTDAYREQLCNNIYGGVMLYLYGN